jgi:hypothetical protein
LRAQATSYCDTLAVLREFCGCWPAYFVPAVPFGLNAEPGAFIELPGWLPSDPQSWLGWPVVVGPRCVVVLDCVACVEATLVLEGCVVDCDFALEGIDEVVAWLAAMTAPLNPSDNEVTAAVMTRDFMIHSFQGNVLPMRATRGVNRNSPVGAA